MASFHWGLLVFFPWLPTITDDLYRGTYLLLGGRLVHTFQLLLLLYIHEKAVNPELFLQSYRYQEVEETGSKHYFINTLDMIGPKKLGSKPNK